MVRGVGGVSMVWVSASLVCEWFGASRVMGCVRGIVVVRGIGGCSGYGAWFAGVPVHLFMVVCEAILVGVLFMVCFVCKTWMAGSSPSLL